VDVVLNVHTKNFNLKLSFLKDHSLNKSLNRSNKRISMNKKLLYLLLLGNPICNAMQDSFIGVQKLFEQEQTIPVDLNESAQKFLKTYQTEISYLTGGSTKPSSSVNLHKLMLKNKSKINYVLPIEGGFIKFAGPINTLYDTVSTLGYDPFCEKPVHKLEPEEQKEIEAQGRDMKHFQTLSALAYYRLIKQMNENGDVALQAPQTWFLHIPERPEEFTDQNYVVVQEALPESVVSFSQLSKKEQKTLVESLPLKLLYQALKTTGLWNLHKDNLLVNREDGALWVADLEKPNNEGFGNTAKNKIAVFGRGSTSDAPQKWRGNIKVGHGEVQKILQDFPVQLAEWNELLKEDTDLQ
jgi:hypothetical protein